MPAEVFLRVEFLLAQSDMVCDLNGTRRDLGAVDRSVERACRMHAVEVACVQLLRLAQDVIKLLCCRLSLLDIRHFVAGAHTGLGCCCYLSRGFWFEVVLND